MQNEVPNVQEDGNMELRDADGNTYVTELAMVESDSPQPMKLKYANEADMYPAWLEFCNWVMKQPGCYRSRTSGRCYSVTLKLVPNGGLQSQVYRLRTDFETGTCSVEYEYTGDDEMRFPSLDLLDRTLEVAAHFRTFVAAVTTSS